MNLYQPEKAVTGPAYGNGFKCTATFITVVLFGYAASIATRFPLLQYGLGVKALLLGGASLMLLSYYWFLRSKTTIDETGIRQTWMFDKRVEWRDVRSAKMIGIPYASWLFPPRLVVRTGVSFVTFNGGSRDVLVEFAKLSLASQMKK
ncbi:PH domain-containing protein [Massilia glaciei]|uniref:PH domain-containing protein n=1 Tax=Massilia glaciei TaxID=1524097 RepID=A0A2U2I7F5_9BURK|nr:PH domain-containing protein [Massilia glaciei]